ncbi:MAG: glycosyltransferase [Planctomycetes bacterium]|jgi:glycosyltransferase involved in cell wall biosynthesis|nr:glycosyltransferase [Planctomycetota bacterium]
MKICLINNVFYPYSRGGAEQVVEILAEKAQKAGQKVIIISSRPMGRAAPAAATAYDRYYLPSLYYFLNRLPKFLRLFYHIGSLFDLFTARYVKNILKKEKCDLVVTNNLTGLSLLIPAVIKKLQLKHVHILHDIQLLHPSGLMLYGQEKKLATWPAKAYRALVRRRFPSRIDVISPSRWLAEEHVRQGLFRFNRIKVHFNPVSDCLKAKDRPKETELPYIFLYVGQLAAHKGISLLISAFKKLKSIGKANQLALYIVGDGPDRIKIEQSAAADKDIKFFGRLEHDQIFPIMAGADCIVVPSLCYENSPTVVYEAASQGLGAIAAAIGGLPELIDYFGGFLFAPANQGDLIKKMRHVSELPAAERKKNSLQVLNKFSAYQKVDYIKGISEFLFE